MSAGRWCLPLSTPSQDMESVCSGPSSFSCIMQIITRCGWEDVCKLIMRHVVDNWEEFSIKIYNSKGDISSAEYFAHMS